MNNNRCVKCNDIIPEGIQVCPNCKGTGYKRLTDKATLKTMRNEMNLDNPYYIRLAELEDKIEQGKMLELPCKVGDVFYYASELKNKVEKHIVTGFEISNELRIRTISDCYSTGNYVGYFYSSYFNKTLFFTKAEAEAKLKEQQNER